MPSVARRSLRTHNGGSEAVERIEIGAEPECRLSFTFGGAKGRGRGQGGEGKGKG